MVVSITIIIVICNPLIHRVAPMKTNKKLNRSIEPRFKRQTCEQESCRPPNPILRDQERLKSWFYVTNYTRPIPFRRILRLGNVFKPRFFPGWEFIENPGFNQKYFFSPFCSAWPNGSTGPKKKKLGVIGTLSNMGGEWEYNPDPPLPLTNWSRNVYRNASSSWGNGREKGGGEGGGWEHNPDPPLPLQLPSPSLPLLVICFLSGPRSQLMTSMRARRISKTVQFPQMISEVNKTGKEICYGIKS